MLIIILSNLDQDLVEQTKGKTEQILKHENGISNGNKIFRKIFITISSYLSQYFQT